jgi:hypothetical protein
VIFWRKTLSAGGDFRECYGVLEKGRLDFYKKEEDFANMANPINAKAFNIKDYSIETDYR